MWGQIVIQDKLITFKENNSMHLMGCEVRWCHGRYVSAYMMQLQVHATQYSLRSTHAGKN